MRFSQTLPLALLFLSFLEGTDGRKSKENGEKVKPPSPWAQSGQFSTRDKHLCRWQLLSGEGATELQLSCHKPGVEGSKGQRCIYRGQPEQCSAYSSKGRQFWKQILGKLRRKHHPCEDTSPLKSRLCSSKKGTSEAELHLVPVAPRTEAPVASETTVKGRSKGKNRAKDLPSAMQKPSPMPQERAVTSPAKASAPDKRSKGSRRKGTRSSSAAPTPPHSDWPTAVAGGLEQPTELNADVVEANCDEKWHSLCNFFVNFWNG